MFAQDMADNCGIYARLIIVAYESVCYMEDSKILSQDMADNCGIYRILIIVAYESG